MSNIHAITMPKWGMEMTDGAVVKWLVQEGAEISANDEIVEIETTKLTNVYESPVSGTMRRIVMTEGISVPVKTLLAVITTGDVADEEIAAFVEKFSLDSITDDDSGAQAPVSLTVETGVGTLHYVKSGEAAGPPVVLIHGFGADLNSWMFNQSELSAQHTVYALDLPGHGSSTKQVGTGEVSYLSSAIAAFIENLDLGSAHLVGHSLGGGCALSFALEHPQRTASLTLISPVGLGPEINMQYIDGFIATGRRKEMKSVLLDLFYDQSTVSRDMVNDVLKNKRVDGANQALTMIGQASFSNGVQSLSMRQQMKELSMPVQIIWGADDKIIPASQARDFAGTIGVHVLENAGHMAHMEKSAKINALINEITAVTN
jgi:pyruvate dehydrogenase E2 component (dihydrolipoamide acetyltransferase)